MTLFLLTGLHLVGAAIFPALRTDAPHPFLFFHRSGGPEEGAVEDFGLVIGLGRSYAAWTASGRAVTSSSFMFCRLGLRDRTTIVFRDSGQENPKGLRNHILDLTTLPVGNAFD